MKILNNIYDFINYGRIVYRSPKTGNVIRKKSYLTYGWFSKADAYIDSIKTFLDRNGNVIKTMERNATLEGDLFISRCQTTSYKPQKIHNDTYIDKGQKKHIFSY